MQRGGLGGRPETLQLDDSDLVWDSDRGFFYASYDPANLNTIEALRGGRTVKGPVDEDEHFMAWMRPYSGPSARAAHACLAPQNSAAAPLSGL